MVRKIFFCLLIPGMVFLYAGIEKVFRFEEPQVINNAVSLKNCRTSRQGFAPMVAVKPVLLMLPLGHEAVSFKVEYGAPTLLDGEYYLKPFIPNVSLSRRPHPELRNIKSAAYEMNEFLPAAERSNWFTTQYKNGIPIFLTSLNPVQYNAVSGKIQYFKEISITVHTQTAKRATLPVVCNPFTKSLLQTLVDNKEAVSDLPVSQKDADDYEYLIITSDALKNSWGELVELNKRRCMRTEIQTIDYIKTNMTGEDDAAKMRSYIIQEYTDDRIVFVLLGGDVTSNSSNIPHREFRAQMYDCTVTPEKFHDEKDIKADMYYATLDGDWKGSNTYYGEPGTQDMFWEVYAGRFPVDDVTDLNNLINKTKKYSEEPVIDEVMNLFLAGNFMWDDYGVDVWGGDYVEEFVGVSSANNYTTHGYPSDNWSIERLYDKNSTWQISEFRSKVNTHKPTWIDHMGHGNDTYSFKETNSGVTNSNYQNNGTNANYFIIVTSACYPGNFTYNDCLLEQFVKIENGAVGCIGCSKSSWGSDYGTNGSTQRPFRYMHDAVFNPAKRVHFFETMHALGKEANAEIVLNPDIEAPPYFGCITYCVYETNVLGDPALSRWTEEPKQWAQLPDYTATTTEFTMKTPPYTWVALLTESDEFITTQLTGYTYDADTSFNVQDSTCKINDDLYKNYVTSNPGKKITVRIKAHNYLPYESEVTVTTGIFSTNTDMLPIKYAIKPFGKYFRVYYTLSNEEFINISVYNSKGTLIKTLINSNQGAGKHSIDLNSKDFSNGIYYCKLKTDKTQGVKKILITK